MAILSAKSDVNGLKDKVWFCRFELKKWRTNNSLKHTAHVVQYILHMLKNTQGTLERYTLHALHKTPCIAKSCWLAVWTQFLTKYSEFDIYKTNCPMKLAHLQLLCNSCLNVLKLAALDWWPRPESGGGGGDLGEWRRRRGLGEGGQKDPDWNVSVQCSMFFLVTADRCPGVDISPAVTTVTLT